MTEQRRLTVDEYLELCEPVGDGEGLELHDGVVRVGNLTLDEFCERYQALLRGERPTLQDADG